jgi:hypothetical protein
MAPGGTEFGMMKRALSLEHFTDLDGVEVRSVDGESIGHVNELFCDETTHDPQLIGVRTGFLWTREVVVPVHSASMAGGVLRVPYAKAVVQHQPELDEDDGRLTPDSEQRLYKYFKLHRRPKQRGRLTRYDFARD